MPEQIENPNLVIPIEGEITNATEEEKGKLSLEEIKTELERRKNVKVEEPEKVIETEEEIEAKFLNKSPEEVVKMYKNLEKMQKLHTDELGTLRKKVKEYTEEKEKNEALNLQEVERKMLPEQVKWTEVQITEFFNEFQNDPQSALTKVIQTSMKPYTKLQAVNVNKMEIDRLKELNKDQVVPYVEEEINALISANPNWWKKHGTGIFEHAYDVFRNENFDKFALVRQEELQVKELTEEERAQKKKTFVEGRVAQKFTTPKVKTPADFRNIEDPDEAIKAIEKELKVRNIQFK